jgi:uncharacterized protein (DUF2141 family)
MRLELLIGCVFVFIGLSRCATMTQPNGGPKDTIPPTLIHAVPENNQKNFKGKTLTLVFDEPVKLKDPKEIIITPSPGKGINITSKAKTVTIEPKFPWKDSTTYSIAFREAVQDLSESNPAENLHLAFSTGPVIDSLRVGGIISFVQKETIPDKITVAIYQSDTFNIFKHQPVYFTKTNKTGNFIIENLKPGLYFIYAFDDKNKNLKVESQTEMFGYLNQPVELSSNIDTLKIRVLNIDSRPLKLTSLRHNLNMSKVRFNKPITNFAIKFNTQDRMLNTFGDNQTEINIYHNEIKDSIPLHVQVQDSIGQTLDSMVYIKSSSTKAIKDAFKFSLTSVTIDQETGSVKGSAQYNIPLQTIRPDTIWIQLDSSNIIALKPKDIAIDTARKQASFQCTIDKKLLLSITNPALYIVKAVFISIESDTSKAIRYPIPYLKPEEEGSLSVELKTRKTSFITQLITKDYKVIQSVRNTANFTFKNIPPLEYKLRVILDPNHNGQWDPGNYYNRQEPEQIIYYKTESGKYEFPIRANWEVGPYILRF